MTDKRTYRRLRVAQQAPVDLGEPLVLLHLRGAALAAKPGPLPFVQEPYDDVFACTVYGVKGGSVQRDTQITQEIAGGS